MKKSVFVVAVCCLLVSGCVSTRSIVNYKEKDSDRQSALKQYTIEEKAKRPNPKFVFPTWKDFKAFGERNSDYSLFGLYPLMLPYDIFSTVFISPFTKTEGVTSSKIIVSGQLIDEEKKPIKGYKIYIDGSGALTDDNGFFSKQIDFDGQKQGITITFLQNISELQNSFNKGEKVTIVNPVSMTYSLTDNGKIYANETIVQLKKAGSQDNSRDTLITTINLVSNNSGSNKIVLRKLEFQSDKNKGITIEEQERAERIRKEDELATEQERIRQEKEDKRINVLIDKLKDNKSIIGYSASDVEIALGRIGMKSDAYAYEALFTYFQNGAFIDCRMQILQVIPNQGFLVTYPGYNNYMAYVGFNKTASFYDGQYIRFKGRIVGTYSYVTASNTQRTVPKVLGYIVSSGMY